MKLHKKQLEALPVVDWLFSQQWSDRSTGRSTCIAIALIRQAAAHPGTAIKYVDHGHSDFLRKEQRDTVRMLLAMAPELQPTKITSDSFVCMNAEPIHGWLPK